MRHVANLTLHVARQSTTPPAPQRTSLVSISKGNLKREWGVLITAIKAVINIVHMWN